MKDGHGKARGRKNAGQHRLDDDAPDAFPEEDEEIEGALTVSDLDSLHLSDSTPDDLTPDTLIGDPRDERRFASEDDEDLRVPQHHWIHRRPRAPGARRRV